MQRSLWEDLPIEFKKVEESYEGSGLVCQDCGVKKPLEEFGAQYYRKDGSKSHRNECKSCIKRHTKVVNSLKKTLGPPPDLCECCGKPPNGVTGLVTDHCHTTYKFRGWLCTSCNLANGHLGDKPETIMKLYEYMTKEK